MNSRDLVVICVTIILLLSVGIFMTFNSTGHETTKLSMTSSSILNEGDSLVLKLSDENGSAISSERIQINLTDDNGTTENFTLKTNSNGECKLEDLPAGNFSIIAKYPGGGKYKESSLSGKITVNKKTFTSSDSSNQSNETNNTNDKSEFKSDYKVDDVINGWDPSEHEVSREDLGDGTQRVNYDDGYSRIIDKDGNIITYGY